MGLIEAASETSAWRGLDYYEFGMVKFWSKAVDGSSYDGVVGGSEGNSYDVHVDKIRPEKSTCTCPFAKGHREVCKHMIALYFTAEPEAAEDFRKQIAISEREEESEQMDDDDLMDYVYSLSKSELQMQLYDALVELDEIKNNRWY